MILEATGIIKTYQNGTNTLTVLNGIDLNVKEGEIVTIMGQSGSGKTTLLNILGTIDKPDVGTIKIKGNNVDYKNDKQLAMLRNTNIGFVFQFHHLLPEFTALENVLLPTELTDDKIDHQSRAHKLLKYVGLTKRSDHYPAQLSGGERLRVAVLRALINNPGIVMADEPTGNLDLDNANRLLSLFAKIRTDYNQSFLITTHNPSVAELGDRRFKLVNGNLEQI